MLLSEFAVSETLLCFLAGMLVHRLTNTLGTQVSVILELSVVFRAHCAPFGFVLTLRLKRPVNRVPSRHVRYVKLSHREVSRFCARVSALFALLYIVRVGAEHMQVVSGSVPVIPDACEQTERSVCAYLVTVIGNHFVSSIITPTVAVGCTEVCVCKLLACCVTSKGNFAAMCLFCNGCRYLVYIHVSTPR
jgi:hypothetical protein